LPVLTANRVIFDTIYTQKEDLTKIIKVQYEEEWINARVNKTKSYNPSKDITFNKDYPNAQKPKFQTTISNNNCNKSCPDNILLFRDSFGMNLLSFYYSIQNV